jgi:hypothetical protein
VRTRSLLLALLGLAIGAIAILRIELDRSVELEPALPEDSAVRIGAERDPSARAIAEIEALPSAAGSGDVIVEARRPATESGEDDDAPKEEAQLLVLLTDGKNPVGPATLRMNGTLDEDPKTEVADAITGQAFFTGLEAGYQKIHIVRLPAGWILAATNGPNSADTRVPADARAPMSTRAPTDEQVVDLSPGSNVCEIRLERAARVFGRVLGPEGEPLDRAAVQLTRCDGGEQPGHEPVLWFSVEGGSYQGFVHEGVWSAQIVGLGPPEQGRSRDPSLRDLVPPLPQIRKLHAGTTAEMDFVCDRFSGVIEGRVLDELNRPFGGLQLVASRITTMTDPESGRTMTIAEDAGRDLSTTEGSFAFAGLGRGSYRIRVDTSYFFAVGPPGINGIGAPVEPVDVTFGAEPKVRVQIAARRSHPLRVHGSIVLGPRALAAANNTPSIFLNSRAGGFHRDTVRSWVDGTNGRFDFYVESAVQDPCLEVTIGGERSTYPLTLEPEIESTELVLRFPK